MADPQVFVIALVVVVVVAVLMRAECGGFDPVVEDHDEHPSPPVLNIQVPEFLEFLRRVRQAIAQRHSGSGS